MLGALTPDVVHMCRRAKQAQANMGVDPEKLNRKYAKRKKETDAQIQKMIKARKGIHTPRTYAPEPRDAEKAAMDAWRKNMMKRIQKEGGDRTALLNVVAQEKDVLRQFRHPLDMKKIETLNAEFLGYSQDTTLKASARTSIAGMIAEQTKGVKVPETVGGNGMPCGRTGNGGENGIPREQNAVRLTPDRGCGSGKQVF